MCHFQWPWTKPNPVFKVTPLFGSKYLTNGYRYGQSYYRRRIGNRTQAFEWHQLQWPWVTSKPHFNTGTLLVHCWYSLGRHVTIGTPMVILLFWLSFDCFWLFFTIGTPFVHCLYSLGRPVTIGTPMVLSVFDDSYSVPIVKRQSNSKKWPLVYQCVSSPVYTESAEYTKPRKLRYLAKPPSCHVPGQWPQPVARGQGWLYGRPCVWLPFAAACCYSLFYLYWWCLQLV